MNKKSYQAEYHKKHYTGIYASWYAMKQRCSNPNNVSYKNYGGRGITYPRHWEPGAGFQADMASDYQRGLSLDRIDNNASYSKENCRWVTRKVNNNNKRSNIVLEFNGQKMTLAYWAEKLGMPFDTLRSRFYRGMSTEEILKDGLYRPARL